MFTLSEFSLCVPCPHTLPLQAFVQAWMTSLAPTGKEILNRLPLRCLLTLEKDGSDLQIPARYRLGLTPRRADVTAEQSAP